MRKVLALGRASWLTASSYRLNMLLSALALLVTVVPLYFVAHALQPVLAASIADEGGDYFGFLLIGMIAFSFLTTAVGALPVALRSGISGGTLEALLTTRARLPELVAGLTVYAFGWTAARAALLLLAGWVLGAEILWQRFPVALLVVALLLLCYVPFGLLAAAFIVAFRTSGPLVRGVLVLSALLGGVYYPTDVVPGWLEHLTSFVPLTYGLRALRQALLEPVPLAALLPDITTLAAFAAVLMIVGSVALGRALRYARHAGTLAQY